MAGLPTGTAGVFAPVNIAGALFSKTDTRTPLFNRLGGVVIGSREFVVGADFELGAASQPAISETASLTAPTPTFTERVQATNVTQIFQRAVSVTYRKSSNVDALTGLHLAGQANNVPSELAFQIKGRLDEIRNDMEYTILNGEYNKAANPDQADKTRGVIAAITTNVIDADGAELSPEMLIEMARKLASSPYGLAGVVGILHAEQIVQLNKIVRAEGERTATTMDEAGSNLLSYRTPFGTLNFMEGGHRYVPNGTAVFANLGAMKNVLQPVPDKGNFFYEPLAKTGAAESGQIYGQWGLDHAPEWLHGKITGLAETTTAIGPNKVFIANGADAPVYTTASV